MLLFMKFFSFLAAEFDVCRHSCVLGDGVEWGRCAEDSIGEVLKL
jgi:hypothetical protein